MNMLDFKNATFFKMKADNTFAEMAKDLLTDGEKVISAYKAIRDGVIFTNLRIIVVNVQGITGRKKDFTSIPYKGIIAYSVETAGTFDLDAELDIWLSSVGKIRFEFTGTTNVVEISNQISRMVL
jgi:hypothetical protein